jgi:hypothetical protein
MRSLYDEIIEKNPSILLRRKILCHVFKEIWL